MSKFTDEADAALKAFEGKILKLNDNLPVPETPMDLPAIRPGEMHNEELQDLIQGIREMHGTLKAFDTYIEQAGIALKAAKFGNPDIDAFLSHKKFAPIIDLCLQEPPEAIANDSGAVAELQRMQRAGVAIMGRLFPALEAEIERMCQRNVPIDDEVIDNYVVAKGFYNLVVGHGMTTQNAIKIVHERLMGQAEMNDHDKEALYEPVRRLMNNGYKPSEDTFLSDSFAQGAELSAKRKSLVSRRRFLGGGAAALATANIAPHVADSFLEDGKEEIAEDNNTAHEEGAEVEKSVSMSLGGLGVAANILIGLGVAVRAFYIFNHNKSSKYEEAKYYVDRHRVSHRYEYDHAFRRDNEPFQTRRQRDDFNRLVEEGKIDVERKFFSPFQAIRKEIEELDQDLNNKSGSVARESWSKTEKARRDNIEQSAGTSIDK